RPGPACPRPGPGPSAGAQARAEQGGHGDRPRAPRIALRVCPEPGRTGTLPDPAARGGHALEPREIRRCRTGLAARRRIRTPGERPESADRDTHVARLCCPVGPDAGTGRNTAL